MNDKNAEALEPVCARKLRRSPWRIPAKDKPQPSLLTDGRTVKSWLDIDCCWSPFSRVVSTMEKP